jgi:hypothetical protein
MPVPVALFVYNRVSHLNQTITSLKANHLAPETDLFIFSDGAKDPSDQGKVAQVRSLIRRVDGFKSVTIEEQNENLGLSRSIIRGVSKVIDHYHAAIVLEDDMVSSPYFLAYMNDGLSAYQNDERVVSIHGYLYPLAVPVPETFFLQCADCWGWGTWKRGWECFNPDGRFLRDEIKRRKLIKAFNFNGAFDFFAMLSDSISGRIDSWAIRWLASAFLQDKLTLYPGRSLIRNIGTDASGTHCRSSRRHDVDLWLEPVSVSRIPVEENRAARRALENFFAGPHRSLLARLIHRLAVGLNHPLHG